MWLIKALATKRFRIYIYRLRISFDPAKRAKTLEERGLDFQDAREVFKGVTVELDDERKDYGERRVPCFGLLGGRLVVVGYTPVALSDTSLACERQMIVSKPASPRTLGSDLTKVDSHVVEPHEYKDLPELTDDMLKRAVVNKGGRPKSENPRQLISLRLPPEVIERWRSTGPGWQTRMAERLSKGPVPSTKTDA